MRVVTSILFVAISFGLFAQKKEVTVTEGNYSFSVGSKNAIIITIPDSKKDLVNKVLVKEIKSWSGKMKSSKAEITTFQSVDKKLFDGKAFDSYTKIHQEGTDVKIAVTVDLGGAFLTSKEHPGTFTQFYDRLYKFAVTAGSASVAADAKNEEKILKSMKKELSSLEKEDANYKKSVEKMKKEIEKTENSIKINSTNIDKKKEEITAQQAKINEIKKTKVK